MIGIIPDIHGNYVALKAVLSDLIEWVFQRLFALGILADITAKSTNVARK
jgi:hypothetical protein